MGLSTGVILISDIEPLFINRHMITEINTPPSRRRLSSIRGILDSQDNRLLVVIFRSFVLYNYYFILYM